MQKKALFFSIFFLLMFFCSCGQQPQQKVSDSDMLSQKEGATFPVRDIDEIKKSGKLKVLITYSSTSYFLYRGKTMGFEYEFLERLADSLGLKLEFVIVKNMDAIPEMLQSGAADIVAHGMTITNNRKKVVSFTDYLYLTHQVLVQRQPKNWRKMKWSALQKSLLHDAVELAGKRVSVRKNSSYYYRLTTLSDEIGGKIEIDELSGELTTEDILKMVADGKIEYTVADSNIAAITAAYYPILDIRVPISLSQRIGWMVNKKSPKLLNTINLWLRKFKKSADYHVIYNKYFKNRAAFKRRAKSDFFSKKGGKISKYDALIKKEAKLLGWDWRLLASLIYQESEFNPKAKSWAGAKGLMQMMPATAKEYGVKNRVNPKDNLKGGVKFLRYLHGRFDSVKDPVQRKKFTMAAYNCGFYHVRDARKLAAHRKIDENQWDGSVDRVILDMSNPKHFNHPVVKYGYVRGREPYNYVNDIFERYAHYQQFVTE
ncbi:transporter substrate-binding domain-containing protein [bacterium]|nr:transporter substrate-binding domain-containing protein [bacterium]